MIWRCLWDNFLACEHDLGIIITLSGMHEGEFSKNIRFPNEFKSFLHEKFNEFLSFWGYFYQHGIDLGIVWVTFTSH